MLKKYDESKGMFITGRTKQECSVVKKFLNFNSQHVQEIYWLAEEPVGFYKQLCSVR
jgi:hypothetical protein